MAQTTATQKFAPQEEASAFQRVQFGPKGPQISFAVDVHGNALIADHGIGKRLVSNKTQKPVPELWTKVCAFIAEQHPEHDKLKFLLMHPGNRQHSQVKEVA